MPTAPQSFSNRPSRAAPALAAALLLTSIVAFALQETGACGSCALRQGPWSFVAPAGVIGYSALVAIGFLSPYRLFPIGSAIAASVHTVLLATMVILGRLCPVCIGAAVLALALFVVSLVRCPFRMRLIAAVYVPAVLLASGPAAWALAHEEALETERQAFVRAIQESRFKPDRDSVLTIQVFEQDHCGYCRDFREMYLPRLERDFGDRMRVRFLPATATNWVRRTPTIVIEGGAVYEGLPETYSELRAAVEEALSSGK